MLINEIKCFNYEYIFKILRLCFSIKSKGYNVINHRQRPLDTIDIGDRTEHQQSTQTAD